jgi:hypothetical protein
MNRHPMWVFILALFLVGCGGGGGGSSNSSGGGGNTTVTYDLNAAVSAYEQENHNYILNATNGGNVYTLLLNTTAGGMGSFNGQVAYSATKTVTLSENGTVISNDVETGFFLLGPFEQLGAIDTNGQVTVDTHQVALPNDATVGQSGAYGTATIYTDSSLNTVYGSLTATWSLNSGSGSNAVTCLNSVGTVGGISESESDCYTLDSSSNFTGTLTITLDVNGTILDFH